MKKQLRILFIILFWSITVNAQNKLDTSFNVYNLNSGFDASWANDTSFIIWGGYYDTTCCFQTSANYFPNGFIYNYIIKLNTNGKKIKNIETGDPYKNRQISFFSSFIKIKSSLYFLNLIEDSNCIIASQTNPGTEKREYYLNKYDISIDSLSRYKINLPFNDPIIYNILYIKENGTLFWIGCKTNTPGDPSLFFLTDTLGNIIWQSTTSTIRTYPETGIRLNDNEFFILGTKSIQEQPGNWIWYNDSLWCCKINLKTGSIINEQIISPNSFVSTKVSIFKSLVLSNGNLLVSCIPLNRFDWTGDKDWHKEFLLEINTSGKILRRKDFQIENAGFQPKYEYMNSGDILLVGFNPVVDSLTNDDISSSMYLAKIDSNFNIKWKRKFIHPSYPFNFFKNVSVNEKTNDILVFGSVYQPPDWQINKETLWVMNLDSFGCLVSGCQLHDAVQEIKSNPKEEYLKVYPNPFTQYTTVNCNLPLNINEAELFMINSDGKIINTQSIKKGNNTNYEFNCSGFSSGIYYIMLKTNGRLLESKKVLLSN